MGCFTDLANPSKHEALAQCCFDVGPPLSTPAQHQTYIASMARVCWVTTINVKWAEICDAPHNKLKQRIVQTAVTCSLFTWRGRMRTWLPQGGWLVVLIKPLGHIGCSGCFSAHSCYGNFRQVRKNNQMNQTGTAIIFYSRQAVLIGLRIKTRPTYYAYVSVFK